MSVSIAIFTAMTCATIYAGDSGKDLVSESEFFTEIPPVATVTRLPQLRSETPASVTIIDSMTIRKSGARDIADLFRLIPGFQVAFPRGDKPAVTYHGLGDEYTRRMQILVDGRSVYGALFGHVSWSTQAIALDDIERIEVVRGPNTVSYGANAFLGTINIITRHSLQSHGVKAKVAGGNHDIRDAGISYGTGFVNGDVRITSGYRAANGLDELPDDYKSRFVNLRSDLRLGLHDSILFQTGISRAEPTEGYDNSIFAPPTRTNYYSHFEQVKWQHQYSNDNELSVQLHHNYRDVDFNYLSAPLPLGPPVGTVQLPISYDGTAHQYGFETQQTLAPSSTLRLVWGIGVRRDAVKSTAFFANSQSESTNSSRFFTNAEWRITPELISNAGIMWENTDFTGTDLSPRLALNYHISENGTVRTVFSRARRIPSLFEEYGDYRYTYQNFILEQVYLVEGGLKPESMSSVELGYFGQLPRHHTTIDIRVYRDRISNFISQNIVPASDLSDNLALSYKNEGEITIDGIDMELSYRPYHDSRIILTYARMHASADEVSGNLITDKNDRLESVPDYSGSLFMMHSFSPKWQSSIGYYWTGKMLWLNSSNPVDSYTRLDLRLAYQFKFSDTSGEIAMVVQNADDRYEEFYNNQYFDRQAFMTIRLEF